MSPPSEMFCKFRGCLRGLAEVIKEYLRLGCMLGLNE